jgi:cytochrome c biogenesis protein CcmG/thiol:disulfide interchange protein DsbE
LKKLIYILPVAGFAVIAFFLFRSLFFATPDLVLPSPLIDKLAPALNLPALDAQTEGFGSKDLTSGKVIVVNVFSSTCIPCRLEAPMMMKLAKMPGMNLYGLVWKDSAQNARQFLDDVGNPFSRIGLDADGHFGEQWGVYGWPETFVVDGHGIIRYKHVGELTDEVVTNELLPAIAQAKQAS